MRFRSVALLAVAVATVAAPAPASSQGRAIDLTVDMLDRWFTAHDKEKSEQQNVAPQLADVDARIAKFEQCKRDFEAAGAATGSRLGGIGARIAIKAKCGSSDADGMRKDRQKIMDGPESAAAAAGKFKLDEYRNLRDKLQAYASGDESGFTKAGLDVLKSRRTQVASAFGISAHVAQAGMSGRGMHGPNVWTGDYAWIWISQLFSVQFLTGAAMFEKDYKPGEWTKWNIATSDNADESQQTERAFLGKTPEGAEWWRFKTITNYKDGDKAAADTVVLEALFKPEPGNEQMQQLVRMRGKFPGKTDAEEMMVPQQWGMWNLNGAFQMKPTKESIDGATVGVEDVKTPAGAFKAKHVRFGQGGGTMNWWLDDAVVGGWVKFQAMDDNKEAKYTMEMIGRGTGAKSETGVSLTGGAANPSAAPSNAASPAARPAGSSASIPAAAPDKVDAQNAITADRLDRFIRGLNAMNAQYVKDSTADAKLPAPAPQAEIDKFGKCETDYLASEAGQKTMEPVYAAQENQRAAANAKAVAAIKAKCGPVPSGYPQYSSNPQLYGWTDPTSGRSERYKNASLTASGLDERLFAMLVERVRAYLSLADDPSEASASVYIFTAAELAALKPRTATLKKVTVHTDIAW